MRRLWALTRRNIKLYFKDKGMFFTSLITPVILLVLYITFLSNVYEDIFLGMLSGVGITVPDKLVQGCVGGQLVSSILAVSSVTVAFCSNLLMVQDKVTGARRDLTMTPVNSTVLALSYSLAAFLSTIIVCLIAAVICMIYLAAVGWYLTAADVLALILDVILLTLFGTALSSVVNFPLSTSGQGSAVGTIISAGYGFLCGAYMPISSFSDGLRNVIMFLPGTYGTSLLRNHALSGVFAELESLGISTEVMTGIRDSIDCNLYFFDNNVSQGVMYLVLVVAILLCAGIYALMNAAAARKRIK